MDYSESKTFGSEFVNKIEQKRFIRICIGAGLVLFFVGLAPYIVAINQQDLQHSFNGYLHYPEDMDSYAAFINQSKDGAFVFYNPYDIRGAEPAYVNLLWLLLGKLSAFGLSFTIVFQILRLISCLLLVVAFGALLNRLDLKYSSKIFAVLLFVFGSGFGWFVKLLNSDILPPDTYTELFPFVQTAFVPHSALAHAFLLLVLVFLIKSEQEEDFRSSLFAGLLMLVLGFFRVYDLIVAWSVCLLITLVRIVFSANKTKRIFRGLVILSIPIPAFIYSWWLTSFSEGFSIWSHTNSYFPPEILTLIPALGIPFIGTLFWLVKNLVSIKKVFFDEIFLFLWIVAAFVIMYSGILPFAWRTCTAFVTPLVIASIYAFDYFRQKHFALTIVMLVFLLVSFIGSAIFLKEKTDMAYGQYKYYFRSPEEVEAMKWLDTRKKGTRVFTHGHIELKIPAYSQCITFVGHKDLTKDFNQKKMVYAKVVNTDNEREIREVFNKYDIDLLYWGPLDKRFARKFNPSRMPKSFVAIYQNPLVTIYEYAKP